MAAVDTRGGESRAVMFVVVQVSAADGVAI